MTTETFRRMILLPWIICTLGAVFYCYEYFLRISPSVMTSELMSRYHLTGAQLGNLSAFYYYAYVPMQIMVGLLLDRFGPRRLLTCACVLSAVGVYLFAGDYGLFVALFGRFLLGFGSAFAFVGALKLATIWLPPNRFALVSGIILCLGMIGAWGGDNILQFMVTTLGWQKAIYIAAAAGLMLSVILFAVVRDFNPLHAHSNTHQMHFTEVFLYLKEALKSPQIWLNGLVGLLLYISLSAFSEFWGIKYLEQAHDLTKTQATFANSLSFIGWAVGGPVWGWLSDTFRRRCLPLTVASIGAFVLICVLLYVPGLSLRSIQLILFFLGIFSSAQILVFAIGHEISQMKIAGTAIALTNMIVMLSGLIFQPLIGKFLDWGWTGTMLDGARVYPIEAYQMSLCVIPISIFIAGIVTLFIRETHCSIQSHPR
jgi:sugar phosphate permease